MNITEIESALAQRLRDQVPGVDVLSASDLAGVSAAAQVTPALHVLYDGYEVSETGRGGRDAAVVLSWLVVVAVRNVRQQRDAPAAARQDAGPLCRAVTGALMGWRPLDAGMSPMALATPPRPGYEGGFLYFPLRFVSKQAWSTAEAE